MKCCMNIYPDNLLNPIEYEGRRSKIKDTWAFSFRFCLHDTCEQYLASSKGFTCSPNMFDATDVIIVDLRNPFKICLPLIVMDIIILSLQFYYLKKLIMLRARCIVNIQTRCPRKVM